MKKNLLVLALAAGLISFAGFNTLNAQADTGSLDGIWINTDSATNSIPRVEISGTQFVWWSKMAPEDRKNGPIKLTLQGNSEVDDSPAKHGYTSEAFDEKFFIVRPVGEQLVLETMTILKGDSEQRANYLSTLTFKKQSTPLKEAVDANEQSKPLKEVVDKEGNRLTLYSLSVPPGKVLKGGERVNATINYKAVSSKKVRIWVMAEGAGFYEPSRILGEEGGIIRFFGSSSPAKAHKIVVSMKEVLEEKKNR